MELKVGRCGRDSFGAGYRRGGLRRPQLACRGLSVRHHEGIGSAVAKGSVNSWRILMYRGMTHRQCSEHLCNFSFFFWSQFMFEKQFIRLLISHMTQNTPTGFYTLIGHYRNFREIITRARAHTHLKSFNAYSIVGFREIQSSLNIDQKQ
jgi:hypothetical protein